MKCTRKQHEQVVCTKVQIAGQADEVEGEARENGWE